MNTMVFLATAQLVLSLQDARDVLYVATPSLDDVRVLRAIGVSTRAGSEARVILAPAADYMVDGVRVMVGSDPYRSAQRQFKALQSARAATFVDPRFSEVGAQSVRQGVRSGMSFAVLGTGIRSVRVALICTGSMDRETMEAESNVCVQSDSQKIHGALLALHRSDFDDTQPPAVRSELIDAARAAIVVSPGPTPEIEALLSGEGSTKIYTAAFEYRSKLAKMVTALGSKATLIVPPTTDLGSPDLAQAVAHGVVVSHSVRPFSGTMIVSERSVFVGSQTMTLGDQRTNRQVGIVLNRADIQTVLALGARK